MPLYEHGVIITRSLSDEDREGFLGELKQLLAKEGASIVKEDVWGKRNLAYSIKHEREGFYVFGRTRVRDRRGASGVQAASSDQVLR